MTSDVMSCLPRKRATPAGSSESAVKSEFGVAIRFPLTEKLTSTPPFPVVAIGDLPKTNAIFMPGAGKKIIFLPPRKARPTASVSISSFSAAVTVPTFNPSVLNTVYSSSLTWIARPMGLPYTSYKITPAPLTALDDPENSMNASGA